jgi:hypothetical protein
MSVPKEITEAVKDVVWRRADECDWDVLGPGDKARYYAAWARDPQIGGVLSRYLDIAAIRVYIKDTVLKSYTRERQARWDATRHALGLTENIGVVETFIKPHGVQLEDGRVVAWGRADNWKHVLLATFERAHRNNGCVPYGAVLTHAVPRFATLGDREVVEDIARRLDIKQVAWID